MCVEAVSANNVKFLNVQMTTDNQFKHEHEENNTDKNNLVCKSQVNQNNEKSKQILKLAVIVTTVITSTLPRIQMMILIIMLNLMELVCLLIWKFVTSML